MKTCAELKNFALEIRKGIVEAIAAKGGGHIGGSLDLADLLAVLYGNILRIKPQEPQWSERDYVVCSKGHAGPALYAALALTGFFPYERLYTLNRGGTELPGHCDRMKVPGIDATTGSLGQGLSIACGLALGSKLKKHNQRIFCILGDGELAEGQNWEAAQFAAHYELGNLIAFVDLNHMQIDGSNDKVMKLRDPAEKFRAFGRNAKTIAGNSEEKIQETLNNIILEGSSMPACVVLKTQKGAGVPCIEEMPNNHCIGFPKPLAEKALGQLAETKRKLIMEEKK